MKIVILIRSYQRLKPIGAEDQKCQGKQLWLNGVSYQRLKPIGAEDFMEGVLVFTPGAGESYQRLKPIGAEDSTILTASM